MSFRFLSHANRPARVFIRSDDAIDRAGSGNPGNFLMPLTEPIMEAKGVQLLSARIPNIFPQVPDYQRWFFYVLTDFDGFERIRGFRLCATTERQRFFVNYQDLCDQLNDDAKYWIEFDVNESVTSQSYLAQAITPNAPDVAFEYSALTRKILTKNVAPVPLSGALELTSGLNNTLLFRRVYGTSGGSISYWRVEVPAGYYSNINDLAAAIQTQISSFSIGIPMTVTVVNGQLNWTWGAAQPFTSWYLHCAKLEDQLNRYPEVLARNSTHAFGFIYGTQHFQTPGTVLVTSPVGNTTPAAPTLQLASVEEAAMVLDRVELVKPYLILNQILGYNVGELQPAVPVGTGVTIWPASFGDLVRTQTIYIKSNLTLNGTLTSNGMRDVLQTIPVSVPPLGVISYQSSQPHYIGAVPNNITSISIQLYDENGQPLPMTLNAQTEFEIGFIYEDSVE